MSHDKRVTQINRREAGTDRIVERETVIECDDCDTAEEWFLHHGVPPGLAKLLRKIDTLSFRDANF